MKLLGATAFVFALSGLVACSAPPKTPDAIPSADEMVVVTDGGVTYLLSDSADGQVIGQFTGVLLGHGPNLWMYNLAQSMEPQADCSCVMEAEMSDGDSAKCVSTEAKSRAVFTRLSDSELVYPFEIRSSEETESSIEFQLLGQHESIIFIEMCSDQYACGAAHPWHECQAVAFDLESGKYSGVEQFVGEVSSEEALRQIHQHDPEFEGALDPVAAKVLVEGSRARVSALMSGPTCYACSDGQWSSYTNSGWSQTSLSEDLPPGVASFFKDKKHLPVHWFKVTSENRPAVQTLFAESTP